MRESPKIDKTRLPVDAYETWLKIQCVPPEEPTQHNRRPTDYYEEWLSQRVRAKSGIDEAKHKDRG